MTTQRRVGMSTDAQHGMREGGGLDPSVFGRVTTVAERLVATGALPAVAVAVGDATGVVLREAFGERSGEPVTAGDVFPLASISKTFAATAALVAVQEGALVLSEPAVRYVPELAAREVTIRDLLIHASGLPDPTWPEVLRDRATAGELLATAYAGQTRFRPGTRFAYGTLSFAVLAEAIARATGVDYPAFLAGWVLTPAGAGGVGFDPEALGGVIVPPIGMGSDGVDDAAATAHFTSVAMPGAGLWGTVDAVLALGQTLLQDALDGRRRVLSRPYVDLMTGVQTAGLAREGDDPRPVRYGLGWRKGSVDGFATLPASARVFEHDGAFGGVLWVDPGWELVVVVLANRFGATGPHWAEIVQAVYGAVRSGSGVDG